MKKYFIISLLTLSVITGYSQKRKTIYVNENFTEIIFSEYKKGLKSGLFTATEIVNDTAIFLKLRYAEYFGTLSPQKKKQINSLFNKRFKVDTIKTWLIHYIDTLPNKKEMPKVSGVIVYDSLNKVKGIFSSKKKFRSNFRINSKYKHKHVSSYTDYLKKIKNERKKVNKKVDFLHIYDFNKGTPSNTLEEYNYYKDNVSVFKRIFSDGVLNYKTIIVYPNGDFYLTHYNNIMKEKKLLRNNFFKRRRKEWLKSHLNK
jgi:hypothetical protein